MKNLMAERDAATETAPAAPVSAPEPVTASTTEVTSGERVNEMASDAVESARHVVSNAMPNDEESIEGKPESATAPDGDSNADNTVVNMFTNMFTNGPGMVQRKPNPSEMLMADVLGLEMTPERTARFQEALAHIYSDGAVESMAVRVPRNFKGLLNAMEARMNRGKYGRRNTIIIQDLGIRALLLLYTLHGEEGDLPPLPE